VFVIPNFNVANLLSQKNPVTAAEGFTASLKSLISSWDQAANFSTSSFSKSPLKLALHLESGTPDDECVKSWLLRKVSTKYRVYPHKSREKARMLEAMFASPHIALRFNRQITFSPATALVEKSGEKAKFLLKSRISDGVFGTPLDLVMPQLGIDIDTTGQPQSDLTSLFEILSGIESSLGADGKSPMVVSVVGAWGYLDKGLAYGLRIRDRLIADSDKGIVEAHVIGYFGPKLGIKTDDGTPITEGAIVYTRKNQASLRKGLAFRYDTKKFGE
jgi:hypothetical protein